jgi:hypothetical protein
MRGLVIDVETLKRWTEEIGYRTELSKPSTLHIRPQEEGIVALPPFFVQCTENWVVFSMFGVLDREHAERPAEEDAADRTPIAIAPVLMIDLLRRLLEANRDMRVAKFALDERGELLLCAELPTESLDRSEFADAVERIMEYATTYRRLLLGLGA